MLRKIFRLSAVQILIIVLASLGLVTPNGASYSQTQTWSQPISLAFGWFPDVAVDSTGQVHVVWASGVTRYDTVMYTTSKDGQTWSEINDIAAFEQAAGGEATRPGIFIDLADVFHMTFRHTTVYYSQSSPQSAYSAGAWRPPQPISGNQVAYFSRVVRDRQSALHLVFTENVRSSNCPICYHVFYRRSVDNGLNWSPVVDISNLPTGASKPQILIDQQENLHVVWEAGRGGAYGQLSDPTKVMYVASYDGGDTWTSPREFSASGRMARNIVIGLDGNENLVVAWWSIPDDLIYFQVSDDQGRSWSSPELVPEVWGIWSVYQSRLDNYAMATDSAGHIHFILVGRIAEDQDTLSVLHLTWDGSAWSKPEAITTLTGDAPEWPRIAIGKGNQLHVAWFVRDEEYIFDSDSGEYQVWYSRGLASAPEVLTTPLPFSPPTPEPQVEETSSTGLATETPIREPTRPVLPTDVTDSNYTETDGLILLLQSLLPAILVMAVFLVGIRILRR